MNILVIDVGTQSIRGTLFNENGESVIKVQREYSLINIGNTIVEQDVDLVRDYLFYILKTIGTNAASKKKSIDVISVTAQRSSVIAVDKNGKVLRPALMWQDKRASEICDGFKNVYADIFCICGMKPTPVFSAPKMLWLKKNEPHVYDAADKLIGFCEYVLFNLTGGFYTDTSIASRTCLFDITRLEWSDQLLEMFGVNRSKLCQLVSVGVVCAKTTAYINQLLGIKESIPVISAGGDQQCAALGVGCTDSNGIEINAGTGSYAIAVSKKPVYDKDMRVMCNVSAIPGLWILEGALLSAGLTVSWLNKEFFAEKNELRAFENFDAAVRLSPVGANGLVMSSAFSGKGTPFWDAYARGCILNIGFNTTKNDFARALLEGISADVVECLDILDDLLDGNMDKSVRCAGGLSKSSGFNQILADTCGRTMERYSFASEATSLGAFISAAVTAGLYPTYTAVFNAIIKNHEKEEFHPDVDRTGCYEKIRKARRLFIHEMNNKGLHMVLNC